ncbi:flagellar biosynthesis protein FlhF [Lysobacter sp. A286]
MRIKRFIATDMRSALRMVREEQGAESVILSTRPTADGIEVVAATDYDEALVHQALRAATPALSPTPAATRPDQLPPATPGHAGRNHDDASGKAAVTPASGADSKTSPPRDSFASRARAVFRIGGSPAESHDKEHADATLAELTGHMPPTAALHPNASRPAGARPQANAAPTAAAVNAATGSPTHFEAMMNALADRDLLPADPLGEGAATEAPAGKLPADLPDPAPVQEPPSLATTMSSHLPAPADATGASVKAAPPAVHAVAEPDPGIIAMREELGSMRRMIEREMGQFTSERLRGSPARAAAYDMLLGYGCDESLAQTIAAKINPALDPDKVRAPMLAELARMLTISRSEPIDDGGVIALIGPTGAGKTTTVAKLAARFAARHRARDVAMVTTDSERVGAIEQLHAHGRRLGITVCESNGPEALAQTLAQLQDYPLVLVDTAGYGARDRALLSQITWLRATRQLRSLLVLPASAHPHDMSELVRRYRMASPEGVVLTKTDETGRLGAALSVAIRNGLSLTYTAHGQSVPEDLEAADASNLVLQLEKLRRAADNPFVTEDHHAIA